MTSDVRAQYNQLLDNLARELDIPPSKYQAAVQRYTAVGNWLECGEYDGCDGSPRIYPQGSFRLGTVVRPIREGKEADYDIDLVCEFRGEKESTSPGNAKSAVGDRLKEHGQYSRMLDREGRRCWTLEYAEEDRIGFHLDVLPSLPEAAQVIAFTSQAGVPYEMARKAIAITDRQLAGVYSWSTSNPDGYADWFGMAQRPIFEKTAIAQKQVLLQENLGLFKNIEDVPDQLVKTPLQRAIQLLKRHRDVRFSGHEIESDKPISMVVTTLSARLYQQEGDTYSALQSIVEKLCAHSGLLQPTTRLDEELAGLSLITRKPDGTWYIANPVNPAENFADRWHENGDRKARAFFQWASWVRSDLLDILDYGDIGRIVKSMEGKFGESLLRRAAQGIYPVPAVVLGTGQSSKPVEIRNPSKPWGHRG